MCVLSGSLALVVPLADLEDLSVDTAATEDLEALVMDVPSMEAMAVPSMEVSEDPSTEAASEVLSLVKSTNTYIVLPIN